MNIRIDGLAEVKQVLAQLEKDAGEALKITVNSVGEHAQRTMRAKLPSRFTLRGTNAAFEKAIVLYKAKSNNPKRTQAILSIGSEQGGTKASATRNLGVILARHEEPSSRSSNNTVRLTAGGTANVGFFIPSKAFRSSSANPPRNLYPKAVGAALTRRTDGSYGYNSSVKKTKTVKGVRQVGATFVTTEKGIFRWKHDFSGFTNRKGKRFSDRAEPIWWFTKRVRTPARLGLWETAQEVFDRFAVAYATDAVSLIIERGGQ